MFFRLWCWLHNAAKDEEFGKNAQWEFSFDETVQIAGPKNIGIVTWRFVRFGRKLYEVKSPKHHYIFYEDQLKKTNYRIFSKIKIKEVKFKTLKEGHCWTLTKRFPYSTPYVNHVIKLR